jgi:hypothetical protein
MFKSQLLRTAIAFMITFLVACGTVLAPTTAPQPLPSPGNSWIMKLDQSGGIAGVSLSLEITSDGRLTAKDDRSGRLVVQDVPQETMSRLMQLYSAVPAATPKSLPSACADCFIYDLQMSSAGSLVQIHADDTTLANSGAADLISFLRQLRDTALRSSP